MSQDQRGGRRRLARGSVAAWLFKSSVPPSRIEAGWRAGQARTVERCVARSYRLTLIEPGQPCVLWLSGRLAPGVHAIGSVVHGPVLPGRPDVQPAVTLSLRLLAEPVARAELLASPAFADAEVLRMPAGSNPSYLTSAQLAAVLELAPTAARGVIEAHHEGYVADAVQQDPTPEEQPVSQHIEVRPMGPRDYAVVVTEGVDTTHHRVMVPERLLDDLLLDEDDGERLVYEAFAYLMEIEHADAIADELVLTELVGQHEDFLPEMRARLG